MLSTFGGLFYFFSTWAGEHFSDLVELNYLINANDSGEQLEIFAMITWAIWNRGNVVLFKRVVENDASLTSQALNILSDFEELNRAMSRRLRLEAVGNAPIWIILHQN